MLIDMQVASLTVDPFTNTPIVVLKDASGRHTVPIWIGMVEASAIATELDRIQLDRPMTHDLCATLLDRCGVTVLEAEIVDLRDHVFYALLRVRDAAGAEQVVDARPSDAIALALRTGAKIRVHKKVVDKARRIDLRVEPPAPDLRRDAVAADAPRPLAPNHPDLLRAAEPQEQAEVAAALLESLGEGAFGKWKM